jgi:hypothetical protein
MSAGYRCRHFNPPACCVKARLRQNNPNTKVTMKGRFVVAALAAVMVVGLGLAAHAQNVTPESLGSSGLIMTGSGEDRRAVGIGFFVEVPSQSFKGQSFIYLVTARHVLLDSAGRPLHLMSFVTGHGKGGAPVVSVLPPANEWFLDPRDRYADLAALPFSPTGANYTTVPINRVLDSSDSENLGADAYYVALLSEGGSMVAPIMTVHFGRVSIADPVSATVPGAGLQRLCFLEGLSAPHFSGSPVYIRSSDRVWLWGLLEAGAALAAEQEQGGGMVGVLPSEKIAETVGAMAAAQDRHAARSGL